MHVRPARFIGYFCASLLATNTAAAARTTVLWIDGAEAELTATTYRGEQPASSATLAYDLSKRATYTLSVRAQKYAAGLENRLSYATESKRLRIHIAHTMQLTERTENRLRAVLEVRQPLAIGETAEAHARVEFAYAPATAQVQTNATLGSTLSLPVGMEGKVCVTAQAHGYRTSGEPWRVDGSVSVSHEVLEGVALSGTLRAPDILARDDAAAVEARVSMTMQW